MKKMMNWMAMAMLFVCPLFTSCDDGDDDNTTNPVEKSVVANKKSDKAMLLCTFGSTYQESIKTYDAVMSDFKKAFPDYDIYLSFTSATCVNRVLTATGIERHGPSDWLSAFGNAGYKKVAVQSLHVIPGEEYLSLMNTKVKKDFMIEGFPKVEVAKGACLLETDDDIKVVGGILFDAYKDVLKDPKNIVLFMGHGNPEDSYSHANDQYSNLEKAMQLKTAGKNNVFVGTVDYGDMLFFEEGSEECIYAKLKAYEKATGYKASDITIYLAPLMSIAGDHAHNDMWGLEEGDDFSQAVPQGEACWRLKLKKMGYNINEKESHHGSVDACTIKGLGDYAGIRQVWLKHMQEQINAGNWATGEDYQ